MSGFIYRGCQFDEMSEEKRDAFIRHGEYNPSQALLNKPTAMKQRDNQVLNYSDREKSEQNKQEAISLVDKSTYQLRLEDSRRASIICSIR